MKIIESLVNFHAALTDISSAFERFFEQIEANASKLEKLKNKLVPGRVIWHLEELQHELP